MGSKQARRDTNLRKYPLAGVDKHLQSALWKVLRREGGGTFCKWSSSEARNVPIIQFNLQSNRHHPKTQTISSTDEPCTCTRRSLSSGISVVEAQQNPHICQKQPWYPRLPGCRCGCTINFCTIANGGCLFTGKHTVGSSKSDTAGFQRPWKALSKIEAWMAQCGLGGH